MKTEEWRMKNCMEHNYGLGRCLFTFTFSLHGWFLVQHAYLFAWVSNYTFWACHMTHCLKEMPNKSYHACLFFCLLNMRISGNLWHALRAVSWHVRPCMHLRHMVKWRNSSRIILGIGCISTLSIGIDNLSYFDHITKKTSSSSYSYFDHNHHARFTSSSRLI